MKVRFCPTFPGFRKSIAVFEGSQDWLQGTRWFKYDRDYLCVNKSQFVPVIFEPPCTSYNSSIKTKASK